MVTQIRRVVAACAVVGLAAAACASDDDPGQTSSTGTAAADPTGAQTAEPATTDDTVPTTEAPATSTTVAETTLPEPVDTEPSVDTVELVDTSVIIEDPAVGTLEFDIRSAGDPDVADDGKAVILLHGFPETNRSWDEVSLALADSGYYAVAINQRGYSEGARPTGVEQYAATHLVDDVFGVADQLGLDTFHVVGHDWGSLVAWSVAGREVLDGAGRVTSLTAMSVGHPLAFAEARSAPSGDQAERSGYIDVFRAPDSQDRFLADDAVFYRSIFGDAGYSDEQLDAYLDVLGTPEAMSAALDWYRAIDMPAVESGQTITVPTLFVWSTGDFALGREQAELTANFVAGPYTFVEIPDVGHWLVQEAPDVVIESLLDHLSAQVGPSSLR